jgi:hypothetical protein
MKEMDIRFIPREEIDKVKWNSCVHYANNGNIFGYMWYLDHVAKEWDALVEGDYESVLPLVWRKHWLGGKELYQPGLMRELGVYSINVLSQKRTEAFLDAIPSEYRSVQITLNEQNVQLDEEKYDLDTRTNYQILLAQPYDEIRAAYSPQFKEQLTLAERFTLAPTTSVKPETVADFYRKYAGDRRQLERNFHALQRIMYNVLHRGWGFASGVLDERGELLACNFFIYSHKKAVSLAPLESPEGAGRGALAHLMDLFIRNHADRPLILDLNMERENELGAALGAQANEYYSFRRVSGGILSKLLG